MRAALLTILLMLSGAACSGDAMDAKHAFPEDPAAAALAEAAAAGDAARVGELVRQGADPDAKGESGLNLLQLAMLAQSKTGLRALLEAGADPNRPGLGGSTAVHGAAIADDPEYLEIVLAHGGDPDARHGETRATPLAGATGPRTEAQFRRLLEAGADPDAADRTGNTPLHRAAMLNAGSQVLALLEAGADPGAKNAQDATFQAYFFKTPGDRLTAEARAGRDAVVAWLRAHEVPLEAGAAAP
ncbi:ankyrin repeat domain-containing protein [Luteimonas sp. RD2P54]|uniref:Ankyrin repeat domain-containing protein n=1 Tax=Luteimonas endophytica TaxID=3042023 RepID=A0ABT6J4S8_9GAMM|nr:ankyrin repeat domain-containing protein [Luteimonas endophytica]MDH5821817.1 ankyrin repeat domain-containing protein [Luteimonas endophytica]